MNIIPRKLRRGSKVALVAPASPFKTNEIVDGMDIMREMGLFPILGPCVRNLRSDNIHSASVKDRVEELNWAFKDPSISGVIAVCGGMGSAALLPYLDYDAIRNSRKPFLGSSDITALNNGIFAKAGLINFNGQGPNIRQDKGESIRTSDAESFKFCLGLLMSDEPWGTTPMEFNEFFPRTVSPGKSTGISIGGNADTFVHLIGTPFLPEMSNTILFLEDIHKSGEVLGREFLHLQLAGILRQINGVVLGEFADIPKRLGDREPSIENVLEEYFSMGSPCSYGYSFSHGAFTSIIPIGAPCSLDADAGTVEFNFTMAR